METRGYWKLEEEALYLNLQRSRFGRGPGPVVRQTLERMNGFYVLADCSDDAFPPDCMLTVSFVTRVYLFLAYQLTFERLPSSGCHLLPWS
jgi:hypothetical protein